MRGDFVLYRAKRGSLIDWLIARVTKGPYVHVEIDLGNGQFVGEHGSGIVVHPMDNRVAADFVTPISEHGPTGIESGMQWVELVIRQEQQNPKAHQYGWLDIVVDAVRVFGFKLHLAPTGAWDCSHFVALYLSVAGADGPLGNQDPETVSPNDLARAYKLIK